MLESDFDAQARPLFPIKLEVHRAFAGELLSSAIKTPPPTYFFRAMSVWQLTPAYNDRDSTLLSFDVFSL